jgi:hypothetical protein
MMDNVQSRSKAVSRLLCAAVLLQASAGKSAPPTTQEHIRGTVQSVNGEVLTVATPAGSRTVRLAPSTTVATIVQSDRSHITDGSFLGITSVKDPDGSQRAVEVHVFPEAMRGTGEGSYGWDWPGASAGSKMTNGTAVGSKMTNGTVSGSKMTNGTVSRSKMTNGTVTAQPGGSALTLQYKGGSVGSQTITIPPDIPVVALHPGQVGDLQPGVHVFVVATPSSDGALTANRVLAGKDGVVPPM